MMVPPDFIVLTGGPDQYMLVALLVDVYVSQRFLVLNWEAAQSAFDHVLLSPAAESDHYLLLTDRDDFTMMPTFTSYNSTWKRAGYISPLLFNWVGNVPVRYLAVVHDTLVQQNDLYFSFLSPRHLDVLDYFTSFTDAIQRLHDYVKLPGHLGD